MAKSPIFFLSVLILLFSASCEQRDWYKKDFTPEEMKDLSPKLRAGRAYYYQGSVPEQFQLKEAMIMDSTDADLWREFGTARVKRGILDEMQYFYGQAAKRKPEVWAGFRGYLYLYFYRDYERAIADFDLGDEANGMVSNSQGQDHDYMRGICYYGLKDYPSAIEQLDRYINRITAKEGEEWVDVYAFLYRGLSLYQMKQYDAALLEFDRLLTYYPNLADAFFHQARVYAAQGKVTHAQEALGQAEFHFKQGYFHQRPYIEVIEQIYLQDIEDLSVKILANK